MPDETERVERIIKKADEARGKSVSLGGATNVTLSVSSIVAVVWAGWWGATNLVLADDLAEHARQVETEYAKQSDVAEVRKSLKNIERLAVRREMRDLSKEIARLEHKRDTDLENWTAKDAESLATLKSDLAELGGQLNEP